jgi:hypothetical protein
VKRLDQGELILTCALDARTDVLSAPSAQLLKHADPEVSPLANFAMRLQRVGIMVF